MITASRSLTPTPPSLSASPGLQGEGTHDVPAPWNTPLRFVHCDCEVITQKCAPAGLVMQQAPMPLPGAQGSGLHVVPTPWNVPPIAWHWICEITAHARPVLPKQHAPVAGGVLHVVFVQVVLGPCHVPLNDVHWNCVVSRQCTTPLLVVRQQAPMGGGAQGLGLQVVFTPWNTPFCAAHWAGVVMWQNAPAPKPVQQAPVGGGGQFVRPQGVLAVKTPPKVAHCACVVMPQPPLAKQHAPRTGGGLHVTAEHAVPAPWNVPPMAVQNAWLETKQNPLGAQHAPTAGGEPHVVLVQLVFAPCHVPPLARHWAWVAITHSTPAVPRQHAPVGAGVGEHS